MARNKYHFNPNTRRRLILASLSGQDHPLIASIVGPGIVQDYDNLSVLNIHAAIELGYEIVSTQAQAENLVITFGG